MQDIVESVELIEDYMRELSFEQFRQSSLKQDAVIRRFMIIGEASKRLEDDFRSQYDQIPWKKIVGLRNVLAHEYDGIELSAIWKVYENKELKVLEQQIKELITTLQGETL